VDIHYIAVKQLKKEWIQYAREPGKTGEVHPVPFECLRNCARETAAITAVFIEHYFGWDTMVAAALQSIRFAVARNHYDKFTVDPPRLHRINDRLQIAA
jgi:hypothetical protein